MAAYTHNTVIKAVESYRSFGLYDNFHFCRQTYAYLVVWYILVTLIFKFLGEHI